MESRIEVPVTILPHGEAFDLPQYETAGAAGMDLLAAIDQPRALAPGARALVPTGIAVAVPAGYEAQIRPRSGLALRSGLACLNSPGTIDSDYRGEIKVILINHGDEVFQIAPGMRIAQIVFAPVVRIGWKTMERLPITRRGGGGFGHTGV